MRLETAMGQCVSNTLFDQNSPALLVAFNGGGDDTYTTNGYCNLYIEAA